MIVKCCERERKIKMMLQRIYHVTFWFDSLSFWAFSRDIVIGWLELDLRSSQCTQFDLSIRLRSWNQTHLGKELVAQIWEAEPTRSSAKVPSCGQPEQLGKPWGFGAGFDQFQLVLDLPESAPRVMTKTKWERNSLNMFFSSQVKLRQVPMLPKQPDLPTSLTWKMKVLRYGSKIGPWKWLRPQLHK